MFKIQGIIMSILCSSAVFASGRDVLIFVPGYYGSSLIHRESQKEVFLNLSSLLFNKEALLLSPHLEAMNPLKVGPVVTSLTLIPGLFSIDAYGEVLQLLASQSKKYKMDFFSFSYDWRLDPVTILREFEKQLLDWKIDLNKDRITLVAHSFGALLMGYWLRYGSAYPSQAVESPHRLNQIKRALLVAAPFQGSLAIFRNSFFGAPGLPNNSYLGPNKVSSFPSTYYLTPNEGQFLTLSGEEKTLWLKDFNKWQNNNWGALQFHKDESTKAFIRFHIEESRFLYQKLHAKPENLFLDQLQKNSIKVHIYLGHGFPTEDKGVILNAQGTSLSFAFTRKQQKEKKIQNLLNTEVDGDQTIAVSSATPPSYFTETGVGKVISKNKAHLEIMKDSDSIDWESFFKL